MAFKAISVTRHNGGIAVGDKENITSVYNQNGLNSSFRMDYGANIHDEPSKWSALPAPLNVLQGTYNTATLLKDELRWFVNGNPYVNAKFAYGSLGNIYQEDQFGNWTNIHTAPNSVGQGMVVFNNYLYYVQNTQIGQYGPLSGGLPASFNDSWQTGLNPTSALGFAPCLVFGFGFAVGHGNSVGFFGNNITVSFNIYTTYTSGEVISYIGQFWQCILTYTTGQSPTTPDADATHWQSYATSVPPYQWTNAAITLPIGTSCMSFTRIEQYLAIGTVGSNSVFDNENGYIFMWDGSSPQWNFFNNIEQGANNALVNYRNQPLSINGSQGIIYIGYDPFVKVHQLPKLPISGAVQVYPGAVTSWKGKVYIGFGANSTDNNFRRGVYAWGAKVNAYPDALSCDFLCSTGNSGVSVQITAVAGFGNSLYIGWRDGNLVGIDKVTYSNPPQAIARVDYLIFDDKRVSQEKRSDTIQVYHSALRVGESVSIYYRCDRIDDLSAPFDTTPLFTHTYSATDTEPNFTRWSPETINNPRFNELEIGVSIGCGTTTPYVYATTMKYNDLATEEKL